MAASSIIQSDGERVLVIDLLNIDTDEAAFVAKVDPAALAPNAKGEPCVALRIMKSKHTIGAAIQVDIFFEATVDQLVWTLPEATDGHQCFKSSGYLKSPDTGAAGFTGVIGFITRGTFAAATGSGYAIRLECEKLYSL